VNNEGANESLNNFQLRRVPRLTSFALPASVFSVFSFAEKLITGKLQQFWAVTARKWLTNWSQLLTPSRDSWPCRQKVCG